MSGWDSVWDGPEIKVDGRKVPVVLRAVYDTPHYVALGVHIMPDQAEKLGFSADMIDLDYASRESSRVDARNMSDLDVYDLLEGKLKKYGRILRGGITMRRLLAAAAESGAVPERGPALAASRPPAKARKRGRK